MSCLQHAKHVSGRTCPRNNAVLLGMPVTYRPCSKNVCFKGLQFMRNRKQCLAVRSAGSPAAVAVAPDVPMVHTTDQASDLHIHHGSLHATNLTIPAPYTAKAAGGKNTPGDLDRGHFKQHSSVRFWSQRPAYEPVIFTENDVNKSSVQQDGASLRWEDVAAQMASDPQQLAAYWMYHLGRYGFFSTQAAGSLLMHHMLEASTSKGGQANHTPLQRLLSNISTEAESSFSEAVATFYQDAANIQAGKYKMPWDMTTLSHQQYNPMFTATRSLQFLQEAVATLNRKVNGRPQEIWLQSGMYPEYYQSTFHYQGDGWFSGRSASMYDFSTEALFLGRQDAMQRTSLLPLVEWLQGRDPAHCTLLEVACGTGRFHTFIKDNYPKLRTIASDLSPYYLEQARQNIKYWKSCRAAGQKLGGLDEAGTSFMQAPAEKLALADGTMDVVVCVYLFHEMPPAAREQAVREMYRVLKPGGLIIFTDSAQLGDRPSWDRTMGDFQEFNEPYFRSFISQDLCALFRSVGFQCGTKYLSSFSKTLSFTKPAEK